MDTILPLIIQYSGEIIVGGIALIVRSLEIRIIRKRNRQA